MNEVHDNRRFVASLFIADLVVVLLFVALGMFSHLTWSGFLSLFPVAFPFLLAWIVWGFVLGTFRAGTLTSAGVGARTALLTWALASPTGILLRTWMLGRVPHWSFFVVAFTLGAAMLVVWRGALAWIVSRRQPGPHGAVRS